MKLSKLTDYSMVILSEMKEDTLLSANKISEITHVPLATTNKILRLLAKGKICFSKGGKTGGFGLLLPLNKISLLHVVEAIEGQTPAFTTCITDNECKIQRHCKISKKMLTIDNEINKVLSNKFISDLL
jgi:Rrf2 family protein